MPLFIPRCFGRLKVLKRLPSGKYLCRCKCGKEKEVLLSNLRSGDIKSCGCLRKEMLSARSKSHGDSHTKLYRRWNAMLDRCERKTDRWFHRYGGRGIKVCPDWHDFVTFRAWAMAAGYEERLEIDRINNDGNYEPSNCRWVTHQINCQNRTTYRGELISRLRT